MIWRRKIEEVIFMAWNNEIETLCSKLKPVLGEEKVNRLWLAYQTSTNQKSRSEIIGTLQVLASKYLDENYEKNVLLAVPSKEAIDGEYRLGKVLYGDRERCHFGLREKEWIQHIGIFGRSGSGKTNTVFIILWNLLEMGKPFLVFDWKRNYRDMIAHKLKREVKVYTIGWDINPFYFNPLVPPRGTNPPSPFSYRRLLTGHTRISGYMMRNRRNTLLFTMSRNRLNQSRSRAGLLSGWTQP
jgi:hypothetical protein